MVGEGRRTGNRFTRRDRQVALLVVEGLTNPEIAQRLGITKHTVEGRLLRLYDFFDIQNMGPGHANRVKLAQAIEHYLQLESIMGE